MRNPVMSEDSAKEWERIKGFVGGANKPSKHPLQQEMERAKMKEPQHLYPGGNVEGNEDLPQLLGDLTPGSSTQLPINTSPSVPDVPHGTLPGANLPISPLGSPTPRSPAATLPQGMPSPVSTPQGLNSSPSDQSYTDQASKILGGVTPEKIQQLMDSLNSQSRRGQIGAGIAGIGDAISSVGGIKGEHMKNAEDFLQKNKEMGMKIPAEMAAVGKENYGLAEQLKDKDPNSSLSKVAQKTYGPDLIKMGLTQDQVVKMPASLIGDLFSKKVTLEDAKARIEQEGSYQRGMLQNTRMGLEQSGAHNKVEEKIAQEGKKQEEAKALANKGMFKSILDMVPGTAGHTANKVLEKQAMEGENKQTGPFGQETVKDGKTYEWSNETGKYHLKQ